jgi:hypothetical protein
MTDNGKVRIKLQFDEHNHSADEACTIGCLAMPREKRPPLISAPPVVMFSGRRAHTLSHWDY